jgi:ABC-type multidrug transport system fused ATPase/permease subunit
VSADKGKSGLKEPEAPREIQKGAELKGKLSRLLSHPVVVIFNILALILTLVGFPLSIYFYYAAKEYPQLTYNVNPGKAVVVGAGQVSRLTASYDGRVIDTDITAAQVAIWNRGTRAIKRADILKPIVIYTKSNVPILEASIRKTSRDVVQLALNTDELEKGRLTILWSILERNDGGVIQIIYAGNPGEILLVDGVIEGQPQIDKLDQNVKAVSVADYNASTKQENRITAFIFTVGGLLLLCEYVYLNRRSKRFAKEHGEAIKEFNDTLNQNIRGMSPEELKALHKSRDEALYKVTSISDKMSSSQVSRVVDLLLPIFIPLLILFFIAFGAYALLKTQEYGPPFGF